MQLVQLIVQNDAAHAVVNKLGNIGLLQFRDLNAGTSFYKRSFVDEVRKCDDLLRILRGIEEELGVRTSLPATQQRWHSASRHPSAATADVHYAPPHASPGEGYQAYGSGAVRAGA